MVFNEAAAFSVPSLTFDVGGVASVVADGVSGFVFPRDATPTDFADKIAQLWQDRAGYTELRRTARGRYAAVANWPSWATSIGALVTELAAGRRALEVASLQIADDG